MPEAVNAWCPTNASSGVSGAGAKTPDISHFDSDAVVCVSAQNKRHHRRTLLDKRSCVNLRESGAIAAGWLLRNKCRQGRGVQLNNKRVASKPKSASSVLIPTL
jgi:hypothetical protein